MEFKQMTNSTVICHFEVEIIEILPALIELEARSHIDRRRRALSTTKDILMKLQKEE